MPIIREMSNMEKIAILYYGKSKTQALEQTNYNNALSLLRVNSSMENYIKYYKAKDDKFKSNSQLFSVKFDSSFPESSLNMKNLYLDRRSQTKAFSSKKISRAELEKILKWGIFYNQETKRFTVPCGGGLYHYEIYICLFQSYLLPLGLYRYNPQTFELGLIKRGNYRKEAVDILACYFDRLNSSTGVVFLTSDLSESKQKYNFLSERIALLDVGHLMHSLNLSFTAVGYGVSNIAGGIGKKIIKFLGENRSNYIASLFFGGK